MKNQRSLPLKWLTQNWGLKLASLVLAAVFWFIVTNYNDPVISVPFYNIPVTLRNTNLLAEAGQVYEVLEGSDSIGTVTITAPRSVTESFTRDNIVAIADFSELTSRDTVPIHLSVNKNAADNPHISGSIEDVRLAIEDRKTRTIALSVETAGQLAESYVIGTVTPAQNLVLISGAASRVDRVASAQVEVDVTGFTSDISTESDIRLYDAEGVLIRDSSITQNISTVRVSVSILQEKTVAVTVRTTGVPAEQYRVTGDVESSVREITVAGSTDRIANLQEVVITGEEFDLTDRTEPLTVTADLRNYLPQGVVISGTQQSHHAEIKVDIRPVLTREITVMASQLVLENMPDGIVYAPDAEETYQLRVSGLEDALTAMDAESLRFVVNVGAAYEAVGAEAPQTLFSTAEPQLPEGVEASGVLTVTLRLQE